MKHTVTLVLTVLVLASLVFGATAETHHSLQTVELNTNPFACDGTLHGLKVAGTTHIKKISVWVGADKGTVADVVLDVVRSKKSEPANSGDSFMTLVKFGWDRYAEPTGIANQMLWYDFAPDEITVNNNQEVRLYAGCNNWAKPTNVQFIVVIYYYTDAGDGYTL